MSELKNTAILNSIRAVVHQIVYCFPWRAALLGAIVFSALTLVGETVRAASAQTPAKDSEITVHTAPDDISPIVETVRDGGTLSPIAETSSAGVKWFMVKTRSGDIGWIKADYNAETKKMDDHFRALPKDMISVGPPNGAPDPATKTSEKGVNRIPILIRGHRVYVLVTFNKRVRGYLLLDTGAYQTVI